MQWFFLQFTVQPCYSQFMVSVTTTVLKVLKYFGTIRMSEGCAHTVWECLL